MWFWWFMLCCDTLIPVVMIVGGRIVWKHPPKEINSLMGYRSERSMKNMDTWIFAHHYSGKLWFKVGWILLPITIIIHIPFYEASEEVIGSLSLGLIAVQSIILIGSIILTERALKKTFTDEGIHK